MAPQYQVEDKLENTIITVTNSDKKGSSESLFQQ